MFYCAGGYHPAYIGESFKSGRYTALRKLGQGHYSTVWMVHDEATGADVAMKVGVLFAPICDMVRE